ncbi:MAG TPA: type IV pilus assembly protein PilM [Methylomirabilota bacterium]|nr:type IV pilus assembly protein PilM [Methylomirabilota bacterium]
MLKSKSFLCLDFGAGTLKAAEFELNENDSLVLKQFGIKSLGLEGSQETRREAVLLKALQELLATGGFRAKHANICAPGFHVFSKFVKLPAVDTSKVTQIIQYEATQNVPFPLAEVVWDYQIVGAAPSGELEVLLVAIKSDVVEGIFRSAEGNNLKLQIVDVSPAAMCNAFRFNYGDLDGCTMLLDIGAKTSNLLLFEKGKFYSRSISIGANAITQDFVAEAKMPWPKAEQIKVTEGFVSLGGAYEEPENPHQAAISKIARQVMTRLHIQVNQTIQFYRGQQGGSAPVRLFLAGGASIMPYTSQFFAEKLNVPVEYFNPFRNVTIDPAINVEELAKVAHAYGEVVGLGLRNAAQCPVELNLVPKSIRQKQQFDAKKPYFIATIFSLVLVVFAYAFFYSSMAGVKRSALEELNTQYQPLNEKATQLQAEEAKIEKSKNDVEKLTGWLRDRFYWVDVLTNIRQILSEAETKHRQPGVEVGVWIETLGTVTPEGTATAPAEESSSSSGSSDGLDFYRRNPELAKRYGLVPRGAEGSSSTESTTTTTTTSSATNSVDVINVKLRAVNLKAHSPGANSALAFRVENEFKAATNIFDPDGTKLSGQLEDVADNAETFTFGMQLKLKNALKL